METSRKQFLPTKSLGKAPCRLLLGRLIRVALTEASPIFTDAINNTGLASVTYLNQTSQQVRDILDEGIVPKALMRY